MPNYKITVFTSKGEYFSCTHETEDIGSILQGVYSGLNEGALSIINPDSAEAAVIIPREKVDYVQIRILET